MTECLNTNQVTQTQSLSSKVIFDGTGTSQIQPNQNMNTFIANVASAFISLQAAIAAITIDPTDVDTTGISSDVVDPSGKTLAEWLTLISGAIKDIQDDLGDLEAEDIGYIAAFETIGLDRPANVKEALDSFLEYIEGVSINDIIPIAEKISTPLYPFYTGDFGITDVGGTTVEFTRLQAWLRNGFVDVQEQEVVLEDDKDNYVYLAKNWIFIPNMTRIKYGYLYNYFAIESSLINTIYNFDVPTKTQVETLGTYLGGLLVAGGKLKEIGLVHFNTPNTGATNEVNFTARGAGLRKETDGDFTGDKITLVFWTQTEEAGTDKMYAGVVVYDDVTLFGVTVEGAELAVIPFDKEFGLSIRLVRTATSTELTYNDGTECTPYIDSTGKRYKTVKIGTQVWTAENIAETRYANGDGIVNVTDGTTWIALTTGAYSAYDNDETNAFYINNSANIPSNKYVVNSVDIGDPVPDSDDNLIAKIPVVGGVIGTPVVVLKTHPVQEDLLPDDIIEGRHIDLAATFSAGFVKTGEIIGHSVLGSLALSGGKLQLSNDETTPDPLNCYSTNSGGTKGWHLFPYRGTTNANFIQFSNGSREFIDVNDTDADARYDDNGAFTFGKRVENIGDRSVVFGHSEAVNAGELANGYDGIVVNSVFCMRTDTTDATPTVMTIDGDFIATLSDTMVMVEIDVMATDFGNGEASVFNKLIFGVINDSGTLALSGATPPGTQTPIANYSDIVCTYTVKIISNVLHIEVTGVAATTIRWGSRVKFLTINNNTSIS